MINSIVLYTVSAVSKFRHFNDISSASNRFLIDIVSVSLLNCGVKRQFFRSVFNYKEFSHCCSLVTCTLLLRGHVVITSLFKLSIDLYCLSLF